MSSKELVSSLLEENRALDEQVERLLRLVDEARLLSERKGARLEKGRIADAIKALMSRADAHRAEHRPTGTGAKERSEIVTTSKSLLEWKSFFQYCRGYKQGCLAALEIVLRSEEGISEDPPAVDAQP